MHTLSPFPLSRSPVTVSLFPFPVPRQSDLFNALERDRHNIT